MANPQEICTITANGQTFENWTSVEVSRTFPEIVVRALVSVSEVSAPGSASSLWSTLKLKPGDEASVSLAGSVVLSGHVYLRQAVYDAHSHSVQIGISTPLQNAMISTVDVKPGQYKKQSFQQIASAVLGKIGVGISVQGSPSGADKIFPRVNEMIGETRHGFISRLAAMRNLHLIDDGHGNYLAVRGPMGAAGAGLQEGGNILRMRLILKNNEYADYVEVANQNPQPPFMDAARNTSAKTDLPPFFSLMDRPYKIA
jgi:prophage tail gpP-like protein